MAMLTISLLLCAAVALSGATVLGLFQGFGFEQALHLGNCHFEISVHETYVSRLICSTTR